jgi:Xaa-Pro aminopeptidase
VGCADDAPPKRKVAVFLEKASPVTAAKALKNEAELAGMREAHLRDSVALVQTLMWVEQEVCFLSILFSLFEMQFRSI